MTDGSYWAWAPNLRSHPQVDLWFMSWGPLSQDVLELGSPGKIPDPHLPGSHVPVGMGV